MFVSPGKAQGSGSRRNLALQPAPLKDGLHHKGRAQLQAASDVQARPRALSQQEADEVAEVTTINAQLTQENEDLRALVLLASSSDSFGNLREEIEQETRDDATTEILHRIQSNAVCVVELLQKMDAILTSENTTVRARATEVLAKCVRSVSVKTTEQQKEEQQQL